MEKCFEEMSRKSLNVRRVLKKRYGYDHIHQHKMLVFNTQV